MNVSVSGGGVSGQNQPVGNDRFGVGYLAPQDWLSSMRPVVLYLSLTFAAAVLGSLATGYWMGQQEKERQCVAALDMGFGSESVQKFFIASKALESIHEAKYNNATRVLLQYAKLQIPAIQKCKANSRCSAWSGKLTPSDADIARLSTMKVPDEDAAATDAKAAAAGT